jgi:hypothetical protein
MKLTQFCQKPNRRRDRSRLAVVCRAEVPLAADDATRCILCKIHQQELGNSQTNLTDGA